MTNNFLKVNKDFFKLELAPVEILILSQIDEFNRTTGDCFISNEVLANNYGVSEKTISRALKALEDKGYITRATKNVKGGKERHITINLNVIEKDLTKDKKSVVENPQRTNCPLTTDKLSFDNGQNDLIKDKGKDNLKDNIEETPVEKETGSIENPIVVSKDWLAERCNHLTKCANGIFKYGEKFYKMAN